MRMPEMSLEPAEKGGSFGFAQDDRPEDEDRIHELVKRANEYIRERMETGDADSSTPLRSAQNDRNKPQFVGPSAELMPGGEQE